MGSAFYIEWPGKPPCSCDTGADNKRKRVNIGKKKFPCRGKSKNRKEMNIAGVQSGKWTLNNNNQIVNCSCTEYYERLTQYTNKEYVTYA